MKARTKDVILGMLMLVLVTAFLWASIGLAEGVVTVATVSVCAVSVIGIVPLLIIMNKEEGAI